MAGGAAQYIRSSAKSCSAWQTRNRKLAYGVYALLVGLSWIVSSVFLRHREMIIIERQNALAHRIETIRIVDNKNHNMTIRIDKQLAAAVAVVNQTVLSDYADLRTRLATQGNAITVLTKKVMLLTRADARRGNKTKRRVASPRPDPTTKQLVAAEPEYADPEPNLDAHPAKALRKRRHDSVLQSTTYEATTRSMEGEATPETTLDVATAAVRHPRGRRPTNQTQSDSKAWS
eukprot:m.178431 g.178431  ORF g.178431 m.178431 type:complete len:232 (+) comp24524_c1_seq1:65-760(+)